MKWVFFGTLILAITLSVIANVTKPKDGNKGVVATLVWATDGNPARQEQMQLFKEWHLKHYGKPIDIKIDPTNSGADKVIIQSISGAGPDLFDYNGRANLERYVKSGVILDVTERAKEKGFPQELVWAGLRPSLVYDGRQYAFTDNAANYLILYHKDVFDRFHVPYPKPGWTWYDFLKIAQKFSFKERNGMRHFALPSYDPIIMMYSNGARMFTPGGTECIINSPEGIEAMQFYRDLQVKYHVMPTASEMADQTSAGGWGSGDINVFGNKGEKFFAMAYGGRYWFVQFAKMSREEGSDASPLFNIGCVKPPIFKYDYESGSA
ncbi:MAG TPA: extracellular solute-binding protein, partial [Armatimonadota bacterium]|nr:extracellular solute-binding protein [Armatimonadota bacterium]